MTNPIDSITATSGVSGASSSPWTQAQQDAMNAAANELGMSSTDLRTALSSGQTLTQLAASKGISSSDLQDTIEAALKKDLPGASDSQISGMASRMMSGSHHAHGGHKGGGASEASSSSSASSADATGEGNDTESTLSVVA